MGKGDRRSKRGKILPGDVRQAASQAAEGGEEDSKAAAGT